MKFNVDQILSVFNRELKLVSKDINILLIIIIAPLVYSFFYSTIYLDKVERDVPIVVVDNDRTETSRTLIRNIDANQTMEVYETTGNLQEAKNLLNDGVIQAVIFIPQNFEDGLKDMKGGTIKVALNTTRFLVSNDLNKAISEVIATVNAGIGLKYFETRGYSYDQAINVVQPIKTDLRSLFNFTESYGDFLVPGMLVLILQQTLLIGLSESMAKERENSLLQGLVRASGGSIINSIFGKGLFYFFLFGAYSLFFFTVVFAILKLNFLGSWIAVCVLTVFLLLSIIFLSLFFSSFFKRKIISLQFFAFSSYPLFLMSGYSWPFESMPVYMQVLADMMPSTPYLMAFQRITQMGAGFSDVLPEVIHIAVLTIIAFVLVVLRFKHLFGSLPEEKAFLA